MTDGEFAIHKRTKIYRQMTAPSDRSRLMERGLCDTTVIHAILKPDWEAIVGLVGAVDARPLLGVRTIAELVFNKD